MNPFKKIYQYGYMFIIHPSGQTEKVTIENLETNLILIDNSVKILKQERIDCINDITKISSKNRIKRFFIKRKVVKDGKTQTQART